MKNVHKPLVESVFIPVGLTTVASAAGAEIHKAKFNSLYWRCYDELETNSIFVHFWSRNKSRI